MNRTYCIPSAKRGRLPIAFFFQGDDVYVSGLLKVRGSTWATAAAEGAVIFHTDSRGRERPYIRLSRIAARYPQHEREVSGIRQQIKIFISEFEQIQRYRDWGEWF